MRKGYSGILFYLSQFSKHSIPLRNLVLFLQGMTVVSLLPWQLDVSTAVSQATWATPSDFRHHAETPSLSQKADELLFPKNFLEEQLNQ